MTPAKPAQPITWRACRNKDGSKDENANESTCGQYTLARGMYAGEWWYTTFHGKGVNAVFLQRSPDRAECEAACESHRAQFQKHHENGDGV